jgi:NAD(P)-dependent dehydrogenase (short-subunit alcohol dehydrogenase family)
VGDPVLVSEAFELFDARLSLVITFSWRVNTMIIIINGGTQGLGEAVARRVVTQGIATGLVLTGRSTARGQVLADELTGAGVPSIYVHADTADADTPSAAVAACAERFGTVNGLVNVAAATTRATLFQDTPEHFDRMFTLNVKAPYFLIQAAAELMISTGARGSIVNVGSTSGHGGQTKLSAYCMSKGAMSIMTKNLAFGLMRHNIRVNQVNPGWMDTESEHWTQVNGDGSPPNWLELAEAQRPMGRLVKPWEVANMIGFCLSDDSGLMTGNEIDIDQSVQGAGDPPIPSVDDTITP